MLMHEEKTCCFYGDRKLPKDKIEHIIKRLDSEMENLIDQGDQRQMRSFMFQRSTLSPA